MAKYVVARLSEFQPGTRRIIDADGVSVGVFSIDGEFYALRNSCPHQGAPLCRGKILAAMKASEPFQMTLGDEPEIIKCPWHGWEFNFKTGQSVFNPHKVRVRTYEVTVEQEGSVEPEDEEEDPSVETYPVTVEDGVVIVHV